METKHKVIDKPIIMYKKVFDSKRWQQEIKDVYNVIPLIKPVKKAKIK